MSIFIYVSTGCYKTSGERKRKSSDLDFKE